METNTIPKTVDIDLLRTQLRGHASTRGEDAFDGERGAWNLVIDHQPDVVVTAANEEDVQQAVRFAAQAGMPIAVQSTGHGQFRSAQGGMLIRTTRLNSISVDPGARTAKVGAGAVWMEVIQAASKHGLAPLSGSSPTVGVIGYLLGGGFGLLVRKYGLSIDHVRSFRIVLPDGSAVTASPTDQADLFWALCGGGGTFGVITEVEIALFPHAEVYGGSLMFPADRAAEVYRAYVRWTSSLSEDVSSGINMITFPPVPFVPEFLRGRSMVVVAVCGPAGGDTEASLEPLRALGPEFDFVGLMPYTETAKVYNDPVDPLPAHGHGVLLKSLDDAAVDALLSGIGEPSKSPSLMIQMRHLGGAVRRNGMATAADDVRGADYLIYLLGIPMPGNASETIAAHAEGVFQALAPWVLKRGPLNFLGEGDVQGRAVREALGEAGYDRMLSLKRSVDPQNLFRHAGAGIELGS